MNAKNPIFGAESFAAGDIIFRQGDIPDKFYIITNGRVNILYRNSKGRDVLINKLRAGDYFGEIGMARDTLRVATVQAETAVSVMVMGHATFSSWLNQSPLNRDEINQLIKERSVNVPTPTAYESKPSMPVTPDMNTKELTRQLTHSQDESSLQTYEAGETIMQQGENADSFYILVRGQVEVLNSDGKRVNLLKAGSYFGEMGLMDGDLRSATVRTLSPVKVITFDRKMFASWMEKSPFSQNSLLETVEKRSKNQHNYND